MPKADNITSGLDHNRWYQSQSYVSRIDMG